MQMPGHFDLAPDEWAALRRLLDDALELPAEARSAWIEALGPAHAAFRPRLRALLAHANEPQFGHLLETLPKVETIDFAGPPPAVDPARQVGPYRLLRQIGEGGMGSVWLAERDDLLQGRQVALKLPHHAWRRASSAERLTREREILATLNHPNIARLYDAGVADDGQPYLALEYVEGQRIDLHCSERELGVRDRLQLFLQVVRAVAHAHSKLVVHRDLKPSNILVGSDGQVRLLDFGIAKLLEQGVAQETELTREGGRALTPDYAAPEQILGEPIGTAVDIYALGVLLFELLTRARPYRLAGRSRAELEAAMLRTAPPRASTTVTDTSLRRQLRGDLDTIIAKALKRAPAERYGTAQAFAEDIERHLASVPVLARPDSGFYVLTKFVARNRVAVGAAAAVLAATLAGAGAALWQARLAKAEQQRAEQVKDFIASIFSEASPWIGPQKAQTPVELLTRARGRVDTLRDIAPATRLELLTVIGESFLGLGASAEALRIADQVLPAALPQLGAGHELTLRARSLRAQALRNQGRTAEMRREVEAMLGPLLRDAQRRPQAAVSALCDRAELELDEGRYADAEQTARDAMSIAARHREGWPGGSWEVEHAKLWKVVAASRETRHDFPAAHQAAEHALRHAHVAYAAQPKHPLLINMRLVHARIATQVGDATRGIALMKAAIADAEEVFGPDHRLLGLYSQNLGVWLARRGDLASAQPHIERSLRITAREFGPDSGHHGASMDAAGFIALAARRPEQALAIYERLMTVVVRHYPADSEHPTVIRMRRALALAMLGREGAVDELQAVKANFEAKQFAVPSRALHALGMATRLAGQPAAAAGHLRNALTAIRPGPNEDRERMQVLAELGLALLELGQVDEASLHLEAAETLIAAAQTHVTPMRADVMLGRARVALARGSPAQAMPLVEHAHAYWQGADPNSRWAGEAALWLARCHERLGHREAARAAYRLALRGLERSPFAADRRAANETGRRLGRGAAA